jgi:hypothetical protein
MYINTLTLNEIKARVYINTLTLNGKKATLK